MRTNKLDKTIIQSVLCTLGCIFILCLIAFVVSALAFPATLMQMSYRFGNDSGAMRYAYRAYQNTGEVYYIAYATEVAIGIDEYEDVEAYAETFIEDEENFQKYCQAVDSQKSLTVGSYRQYVYGQLVLAEYGLGKSSEALAHANEAIGAGFPRNNAYVALLFAALQEGDKELLNTLVAGMENLSPTEQSEQIYLKTILSEFYLVIPNG